MTLRLAKTPPSVLWSPAMDWAQLLSSERHRPAAATASRATASGAPRTDFQRDFDRIVFSTAFRRLHDKTQVFPLPESDLVHSRLTHSLEVSCVGRSLGTMVGQHVLGRHKELTELGLSDRSFGDIVAAACLAHDLGNPPFGHAGEDAIGSWFKSWFKTNPDVDLTEGERADFENFEGNAQGFRILTRLQMPEKPGLQLTLATLAAFSKYPRASGPKGKGAAFKKFGYVRQDASSFALVANGVGLIPADPAERPEGPAWQRHPLAYLMEAADDACYSILDIEDGFRLGLLRYQDVRGKLEAIVARDPGYAALPQPIDRDTEKEHVSYFRAKAINQLVQEMVVIFVDHENDLLAGRLDKSLNKLIPSHSDLQEILRFTRDNCYQHEPVLAVELAGFEIVRFLLDRLVPAVLGDAATGQDRRLLSVLPVKFTAEMSPYERLLAVTDYLSGMTDSFAIRMYRKLTGTNLPLR